MIKNTRVLYKFQCLFYFLAFEKCFAWAYKLNRSTGGEIRKLESELNKARLLESSVDPQ